MFENGLCSVMTMGNITKHVLIIMNMDSHAQTNGEEVCFLHVPDDDAMKFSRMGNFVVCICVCMYVSYCGVRKCADVVRGRVGIAWERRGRRGKKGDRERREGKDSLAPLLDGS